MRILSPITVQSPQGRKGGFLRQRLRKLSRVTTSAAGRSDSVGVSGSAVAGAGRVPTIAGSTGGPANSSAKLTEGSAKLRIAANGIVNRSSCFWKLRLTENAP